MKYYITCGVVDLDEPVSNFRLIAPSRITRRYEGCSSTETCAIRIDISKDQISKYKNDSYATTSDQTLIKDSSPEEKLSTSTVMNNGLGSAKAPVCCKKCGRALSAVQ